MDKEYWYKQWQSNNIGFDQEEPNKLMKHFFPSLQLNAGSRIFVPLCGKSVDMLWLAEQGYKIIGVELSPLACDTFFKEYQIPVTLTQTEDFVVYHSEGIDLFCGDFFKLNSTILGSVDAVYDRAALIALPQDMRRSYAAHLMQLLQAESPILLITAAYDQEQMPGPPFSVDKNEVVALYNEYFNINQVYHKPFEPPIHLQEKGLAQAIAQAYVLTV